MIWPGTHSSTKGELTMDDKVRAILGDHEAAKL